MLICTFLKRKKTALNNFFCLLFNWSRRTWLDDDGPAASLLPLFSVTPGTQPAFGVSLHYNNPSYHLPQQQVQLLHMVVPQKNLPGCLYQVRLSQLDLCTLIYTCFLVRVIIIWGKMFNTKTYFFNVEYFLCGLDATFVVPSTQPSSLARWRMATAFSLLVSGIWWARNAR